MVGKFTSEMFVLGFIDTGIDDLAEGAVVYLL